jgi:hypothetical protein
MILLVTLTDGFVAGRGLLGFLLLSAVGLLLSLGVVLLLDRITSYGLLTNIRAMFGAAAVSGRDL